MPAVSPRISVILVVGRQRKRAQHVLDGIGAQTAPGLETILIDLSPELPPLRHPPGLEVHATRSQVPGGFHGARAMGVHLARSPIAAFIEEHCRPEPGWAEAVIHRFGPPDLLINNAAVMNAPAPLWDVPSSTSLSLRRRFFG